MAEVIELTDGFSMKGKGDKDVRDISVSAWIPENLEKHDFMLAYVYYEEMFQKHEGGAVK